jgi:tetratricopeptide (TPR) repeat protein
MGATVGLYRGHVTPIDRLVKMTVGRKEMLDDLLEKLRRNAGRKGGQHYFFIGPRGIGKTHFLSLLQHAVETEERLAGRYTVIRFPEENSRILSFADVLLEIAFSLGEAEEAADWRDLHRSLSVLEDDQEIIDKLAPRLKHNQRQTGRTLLLLMENMNTLLTEQIKKEQDLHRLRAFLMDTPSAILIGTAPAFFPGLTSVRSPLYEFFDIQVLEELSEELTIELIRRNLELDGREDLLEGFGRLEPKIKALHVMTGGNPRLLMMLYELIAHENILDVKTQFQKLLDLITPFYQDRLKELAPQERALLMTMALMRTAPRTPAAIAAKMRKSQQQTSSLLKRMTAAGYLTAAENRHDRRSRLYRIKEGFFDLWLAMSESRLQRKRLSYLVEFFEVYYRDPREREKKRSELWEEVGQDAKDPEGRSNAFEQLDYLSEVGEEQEHYFSKLELALHRLKGGDLGKAKDFLEELPEMASQRPTFAWMTEQALRWSEAKAGPDVRKWLDDMVTYWRTQRAGDLEKAVAIAKRLGIDLSGTALHLVRIEILSDALINTAVPAEQFELLIQIARSEKTDGRIASATSSLKKAIALCRKIGDRSGEGKTLNELGSVYYYRKDYANALKYVHQSLEINREIGDRSSEGMALNNIGSIHHILGNHTEALKYLHQSLSISCETGDRACEGAVLNNISQIYYFRGDHSEALKYLGQSLELFREKGDRSGEGTTLHNIGMIFHFRGDHSEALKYQNQSLELFREIGDRPNMAIALNSIALIYDDRGDSPRALEYFKQVIDILQIIGDQSELIYSLNYIALLSLQLGKFEECIECLGKAVRLSHKGKNANGLVSAGLLLGLLMRSSGNKRDGARLLKKTIKIGKMIEHPLTSQAEKLLKQIRT